MACPRRLAFAECRPEGVKGFSAVPCCVGAFAHEASSAGVYGVYGRTGCEESVGCEPGRGRRPLAAGLGASGVRWETRFGYLTCADNTALD